MDKEKLAKELHVDEGFVGNAYQDSLGYWTIGIGRLIDKRRGGRITLAEAFFLLDNDIEEKWHELVTALPWVADQPDNIQRALCNMAFQLGVPGLLGFKRTLALVQAGKYEEAAKNAMLSKWAKQTPNRAKRVTDMIKLGDNDE